MNIFIMILISLFMVGYYLMDSPSQQVAQHDTEIAITRSDLRTVAQCAAALHNAQINGTEFVDICVENNGIISEFICLDKKLKKTGCEIVRNKKPAFSYIITATAPIDSDKYNDMMEILERYYSDAGTFGIFQDKSVMSGGTSSKRVIPGEIISQMELTDGQLVYFTQYEIPDSGGVSGGVGTADIACPAGTAKTYRFGRWQCIGYNTKTNCGGDMIWDSDLYECVPDETRRPLCASSQTAVIVDSVWECIDPFPEKNCPKNMIARLNYNTLEWECVVDPASNTTVKKCSNIVSGANYGLMGTTLHVPQTSCTDCERMITDTDSCTSYCVPDPARVSDPRCYGGAVSECSGPNRAFYFGFPNRAYVESVDAVSGITVPIGQTHSQNRRFNCLDCGMGTIDTERSLPPYVAICK